MEYKIGQIVYSKAGRDCGKEFVVVGIEGEYLYLSDGSTRKLESPKKKKLKHIQGSYNVSEEIAEKILDKTIENYMLRQFLTHKGV